MKKRVLILAVALLLPGGIALANRDGGGWSGGDRGGGGGGNTDRGSGGWNDGSRNTGGGADSWNSTDDSDHHNSGRSSGGRSSPGRNSSSAPGRSYDGQVRRNGGYTAPNGNYPNFSRPYGSNGLGYGKRSYNSSNPERNFTSRYGANVGGARTTISSQKLRRMGITSVPKPLTNQAVLPGNLRHSAPPLPVQGPSGGNLSTSMVSPNRMNSPLVRSNMSAVAGSEAFMAKVNSNALVTGRSNNYYWNKWNGYNYCTYYSPYGGCWYGWNCSAGFFWTQYYCGNWWWYDPWWDRWCYWWNDGWWWQDPATTTVYVYNNGNYAAIDQSTRNNTTAFHSPDGSCTVKIMEQGDAFLYSDGGSPRYLGSNVDDIKFSNPQQGPLRILLLLKDGSFKLFNADGSLASGGEGA